MSPEIILPADKARKIASRLPSDGFEEIHNGKIFRKPNGEFVAITEAGLILSDSQELLRKLPFESELEFVRNKNISELDLSNQCFNALRRTGVQTVDDLLFLINHRDGNGYENLTAIRNFGKKSVNMVSENLIKVGVPPLLLGNSLLPTMVKFISQEQLLTSGFSQEQIDLAIAENNKPKRQSMVRHRKPKETIIPTQPVKKESKSIRQIVSVVLGRKRNNGRKK